MKTSTLLVCLSFFCTALASPAAPFPGAVKEADLDVAACQILHGSDAEAMDAEALRDLLGLSAGEPNAAKYKSARRKENGDAAQYLLVFRQPVALGTVLGVAIKLAVPPAESP